MGAGERTNLGDLKGQGPAPVENPLQGGGGIGARFDRLRDALTQPLQRLGETPRNLLDTLRNSRALWIGMAVAGVGLAGFAGFRLGASDIASIRPGPGDLELPTIELADGGPMPDGQRGLDREEYAWPVADIGRITSCYGPRTLLGGFSNHTGLDIAVPSGTPVVASRSGIVVRARVSSSPIGYGTVAVLGHADGTFTLYAHMLPQLDLVRTQQIRQGDILGYSGNTGFSTGPHLHFEVIDLSGAPQNPAQFLSRRWSDAHIFDEPDADCWVTDIIGSSP